jgi:hypothetical protein
VRAPVATTKPRPRPLVTADPENAMFRHSAAGRGPS